MSPHVNPPPADRMNRPAQPVHGTDNREGTIAPPRPAVPGPAGRGGAGAPARRSPGTRAGLPRAAGGIPVPFVTPFLVQGSCELSQDYFLTRQVLMSPGDVVRPFARADGTVEALVVTGGVLWHLSRSAAETSGWAYTALPGPVSGEYPMTDIVDIAVGTGPDGTVRALALRDLNPGYAYAWADLDSSGTWGYPGEMIIAGGLDRLQSGLDPAGNVYFYAFFTSSATSAASQWQFRPVAAAHFPPRLLQHLARWLGHHRRQAPVESRVLCVLPGWGRAHPDVPAHRGMACPGVGYRLRQAGQ